MFPYYASRTTPRRIPGIMLILAFFLSGTVSLSQRAVAAPEMGKLEAVEPSLIHPQASTGLTFGPSINLSHTPANSALSQIARQGENLYVVWEDRQMGGDLEILFRASRDVGVGFEPTLNISQSPGLDDNNPKIAVEGDIIYIAWEEHRPPFGARDIMLATSSDAGQTFSAPMNVSVSPYGDSMSMDMAVVLPYVYLSWYDLGTVQAGLYLARSSNGGIDFTQTHITDSVNAGSSDLAAADKGVYLVYKNYDTLRIYSGLNNEGGGFDTIDQWLADGLELSNRVNVSASDNIVHVLYRKFAWTGNSNYEEKLYWVVSKDNGSTWNIPSTLGDINSGRYTPCANGEAIQAVGDQLYAVWEESKKPDGTLETDMIVSSIWKQGVGWTSRVELDARDYCGSIGAIGLAVDGNHAYIAWNNGEQFKVSASLNQGASWTTSTYPQSAFTGPGQIIAMGTSFFFTWWQALGENLEVYFQAGSQEMADIEIAKLDLIQAEEGSTSFAAGKPTKLMATIKNYYSTSKSAHAVMSYIDSAGGHIRTETLHLNPGSNLLYLPQNPNEETGGAFIRPMAGVITVTLSLEPLIGETSTENNIADASGDFSETRSLSLLFRPMSVVGEPYPNCSEVTQLASSAEQYLEAIYPLDDRRVSVQVSCLPVFFQPEELLEEDNSGGKIEYVLSGAVFNRLNLDRATSQVDNVLGVVSADWFNTHEMTDTLGIAPIQGTSAVVSLGTSAQPPVHELGHNFNLVNTSLWFEDGDYHYKETLRVNGYWVTREQRRVNDYEFMIPYAINNGQPGGRHWISKYSFEYLLEQWSIPDVSPTRSLAITQASEPVILVQGVISQTGEAELNPWYLLNAPVDLELKHPGQYHWEYYNSTGNLLDWVGFDLDFTPPPDAKVKGMLPSQAFAFRIPNLPDTQRIVLTKDGDPLIERVFSAHTPQVSVTYPNGGETLLTGDPATITWTASDVDGDSLSYLLELSQDNGLTWTPLDVDVTGLEYTFSVPENILSNQVLVRVTATDGVNTASDTSDAPFRMKRNAEQVGCFSEPINLTQSAYGTESPIFATSGSHVYLLYSDARDVYEYMAHGRIVFRASHDGGQTWEAPIELYNQKGFWLEPKIAVTGSNVYITWGQGSYSELPMVVISHDYGNTFSSPIILADNYPMGYPSVLAEGNSVYVWWLTQGGPGYLRVSQDAGETFAPAVQISNGTMSEIRMVLDGSTLHAIWSDNAYNSLWYTRSTNSGASFEPARMLDGGPDAGDARILAEAGKVYITATKYLGYDEYAVRIWVSLDGGGSFQAPVIVGSSFSHLFEPSLLVNGQDIHVFYLKSEIYPYKSVQYSVSRDGGQTFSTPVSLSGPGDISYWHQELVFGNQVWSFWTEKYKDSYLGNLYVDTSTDHGLSFDTPKIISPNIYADVYPNSSVLEKDGTVFVAWMKEIPISNPDLPPKDSDILFAKSVECQAGSSSLVNPVPVPPVLDEITVPELHEGVTTAITLTASDPNYDALYFKGENLPDFAVLETLEDGQARWILEPPYGSAGSYTDVRLIVSDGVFTDTQAITLTVIASNQPPLARTTGPYLAPEGGELLLDAGGSFDPDGGALTGSWLLSGQTYTGLSVRVPVSDNFSEPITLTVRDASGAEGSSLDLAYVYNLPPTVTINRQGQQLATFSDPGVLDTHTATIDWGDGTPLEGGLITESNGSGTVSGKHSYKASGTYTVTVTVQDKDGGLGTATFTYQAHNLYLPCIIR